MYRLHRASCSFVQGKIIAYCPQAKFICIQTVLQFHLALRAIAANGFTASICRRSLMDVLEALFTRRSIRKFTAEPV
ncbi:MAG: hypothetical protein QM665_09365, partial [Desulfovibrio sp.]